MTTTLATLQTRLSNLIGDVNSIYADKYTKAINNASREIYPTLFKRLLDETLITGNALPNAHFEDWTETTYPDHYSLSNATAVESTTAGTYRGGTKSMKVTASAADGYVYITSNDWPGLLDLMDTDIDFKCWAYPEVADDAFLTIYTVQADGTAQTLNSTTTCPAGKYTLLELEDQSINDDIVEIQFRFRVHTNAKYAYFDNARVNGKNLYEYLLPLDFHDGVVSQVWQQTSGYSDDICDDLNLGANAYSEVFGWTTRDDGTYKYLYLPYKITANRKLKLIGYCPLEDDLSSSTDTLSLEGEKVNLLLSYAAYLLYEMERGTPSSDGIDRYDRECARWLGKTEMLKSRLKMRRPPTAINWSL